MKHENTTTNLARARRLGVGLLSVALAGMLSACASGGGMQVESGAEGGIATHVPEGTTLNAELEDRLSVEDSEEGDEFHATVDEAVVRGGTEVVPAGALIHGRVTAVHRSTGDDDPNILKLHFYQVDIRGESYPLEVDLVDTNPESTTGEDLTKIGAGAAAGAIVGALVGDERGALIGAAVGAAAGTAVVLGTRDRSAVLKRGSRIELRTTEQIHLNEST